MLFGGICCRDLKNVVVVEYGLKLGGDKGSDLMYLYSSFEGSVDDNIEGKKTVFGIKYGMR